MGFIFVKTEDGTKKPSVWVWLILLGIFLGISIFLVSGDRTTGLDEMAGKSRRQVEQRKPTPIVKGETEKESYEMDTRAINEMNAQIERERLDNGGFLSPEREREIRRKYEEESRARARSNFNPSVSNRLSEFENKQSEPEPPITPTGTHMTSSPSSSTYRTFSERVQAEGITPMKGEKGITFTNNRTGGTVSSQQLRGGSLQSGVSLQDGRSLKGPSNILPLGTFIPCVLDGDIVTSELNSHVWANVVLDVTFRRQLQLPKGLVKIRGKTATEPVQNVVDVFFDTMVFADGTELPIKGFAYAAFDPRHPHRFRTRGIPGEIVVPPLWPKLRGLLYGAALGASEAYIQNFINENTTERTTFSVVPIIDPATGRTYNQIQEQSQRPINTRIWETTALSSGKSILEGLIEETRRDMEKYKPYLVVEKGTPFFVQLEETVDVSNRRINGTALAREEENLRALEMTRQGLPMKTEVFPPGDARAQYTGVAPTKVTTGGSSLGTMGSAINSANQQLTQAQEELARASARAQSILQSGGAINPTPPTPQTPQDLQKILLQMQ